MKKTVVLFLLVCAALSAAAENYPYRSDYLWVTVPDHADWLYETGQEATVEVQLLRYGVPQDVTVEYALAKDMLQPFKTGEIKLKGGKGRITLGTLAKPGFLDCRLSARVEGVTYKHHVKVGFSADKIRPYTQMPADFDAFWEQTLAEARKTPVRYTMQPVEAYSDDKIDCYLVRLETGLGHHVYAYLTRPKAAGKYPVVLCPPGAGVKTIKEPLRHRYYAENGFIRMEMEIHGLNPEIPADDFRDISKAFGDYLTMGLDNRDNYYMRRVYAACVRAIDFLTGLPDWNGRDVMVQGGSQGGALSLVTAGLDKRVTACEANHPALSDMAGYKDGGTGGYPHFCRMQGMMTDGKVKTMAYYDVVNFARRISCPVLMTWGYNDDVCPPTTSYAVYNVISAPKEALITPINEHWTSDATEKAIMEWLKKFCH